MMKPVDNCPVGGPDHCTRMLIYRRLRAGGDKHEAEEKAYKSPRKPEDDSMSRD